MSSFPGRTLAIAAIASVFRVAVAAETLEVVNPASAYPEGPLVADGVVYYAEMGSDRVMRWDGAANAEVWSRQGCSPTSVARGAGDSLIVLCHAGALVRIAPSGEEIATIDAASAGGLFENPNASANDALGGIYFSSSGAFVPNARASGAVLYLSPNGTLRRVAGNIHYANGVAVSADGRTLFVSEHLERRVLSFAIGEDGALGDPKVFLDLDDVRPDDPDRSWEVGSDGLAVDRHGNLYVAEYGGGRVLIVDRNAALVATIEVPEAYVTAPALIDDERRIFITAPASLADPSAPGKVYVLENPVFRED
jgi:sugar lactone lactonase YvrE